MPPSSKVFAQAPRPARFRHAAVLRQDILRRPGGAALQAAGPPEALTWSTAAVPATNRTSPERSEPASPQSANRRAASPATLKPACTAAERAVIRLRGSRSQLSNMDGRMTELLYVRRLSRKPSPRLKYLELGTAMAVISGMAKLSFVLEPGRARDLLPLRHRWRLPHCSLSAGQPRPPDLSDRGRGNNPVCRPASLRPSSAGRHPR
jgi:hypothetical protein